MTVTTGNPPCEVTPNYDLVVSAYSSQGLLPDDATTTVMTLSPGGGLIGHMNHSALINPKFTSTNGTFLLSDRVQLFLRMPTAGSFFSPFPAVDSVQPTPLEQTFSTQFDPAWLETGGPCALPAPTCNTAYISLRANPSRLTLHATIPAPLQVYGTANNSLTLVSDRCVTLNSADPSVAAIITNEVTGVQTVEAVGPGTTTVTVGVSGSPGVTTQVPVEVDGIPVAVAQNGLSVPFSHGDRLFTFVIYSSQAFDARSLRPESILINCQPPVPFPNGKLVKFQDVNGDGRLYAVVRIAASSLSPHSGRTDVAITAAANVEVGGALEETFVEGKTTAFVP